jgi:hypothetical protein
MTILKFNFVPINVCNYGGNGTIGEKNIPNYIHRLISTQLRPEIIMARYGFEYFLSGDERANSIIHNSGLSDSLEEYNYKGSEFIDVPEKFYELLYYVAQSQGLEQATILDSIMSELNDTATSDSELTEPEKESVIRDNSMMIKIIDECVKKPAKDLKKELILSLKGGEKELEKLRKIYLYPQLELNNVPNDTQSQKPYEDEFGKIEEVRNLKEKINHMENEFRCLNCKRII